MPISSQKLPAQALVDIDKDDRINGAKRTHEFFCLVIDHVTHLTDYVLQSYYLVLDEKGMSHFIEDYNIRILIDGEHENMAEAIEKGIEPAKVGASLLDKAGL